eukprot:5268639-Prymnesium_polylepis.1
MRHTRRSVRSVMPLTSRAVRRHRAFAHRITSAFASASASSNSGEPASPSNMASTAALVLEDDVQKARRQSTAQPGSLVSGDAANSSGSSSTISSPSRIGLAAM